MKAVCKALQYIECVKANIYVCYFCNIAYDSIIQNRGVTISWYVTVFNRFGTFYLDIL